MTVVLAGGTGFVGSHLLGALVRKGYSVILLKRSTSNTDRVKDYINKIKVINIDRTAISSVFDENEVGIVINTAGIYGRHGETYHQLVESNIGFPLQLAEQAAAHGIKIFINTDSFYNNSKMQPQKMYSYILTKKQLVEWLQYISSKILVVNVKLHHVYGSEDNDSKFIPWLIQQHQYSAPVISVTKGEQRRDFVYIDDVVSGFMKIISKMEENSFSFNFEEYEIGSGKVTTLRDFIERLHFQYAHLHPDYVGQIAYGAIPYDKGELMEVYPNIEKMLALGWEPKISLENGIQELLQSYQLR